MLRLQALVAGEAGVPLYRASGAVSLQAGAPLEQLLEEAAELGRAVAVTTIGQMQAAGWAR